MKLSNNKVSFPQTSIKELQPNLMGKAFSDYSERFSLLRFPLIILIVLIHARPHIFNPDSIFAFPIIHRFPHTAVEMFFVISGFLLTAKLATSEAINYPKLLKKKFFTLFIPYMFWNTLLASVHYLLPIIFGNSRFIPQMGLNKMGLWELFDRVYSISFSEMPIDTPLWFVRNLIVFFAISPILLFIIRRLPSLLIIILALLAEFFGPVNEIGFFTFGMFLGVKKFDLSRFDRFWYLQIAPLILLTILAPYWFNWVIYIASSIPFYYAIGGLLKHLSPRITNMINILGGSVFFIYCAHAPIDTTLTRLFRNYGGFGYLGQTVAYLSVATITLTICYVSYLFLKRFFPRMLKVVSGGRM